MKFRIKQKIAVKTVKYRDILAPAPLAMWFCERRKKPCGSVENFPVCRKIGLLWGRA